MHSNPICPVICDGYDEPHTLTLLDTGVNDIIYAYTYTYAQIP